MKFIYILIMVHALFGLNNMFIEQQQADLDQPIHTPTSVLAIQLVQIIQAIPPQATAS